MDSREKSMKVRLENVLTAGAKFSHEYDFGSTTHLSLKVVSEEEGGLAGQKIRVLARNEPPPIACEKCGQPAVQVCVQCLYAGEGWLCEKCASEDECGDEMFLPVVNSPRVGVCGYTG
jgi:hypothetical protein